MKLHRPGRRSNVGSFFGMAAVLAAGYVSGGAGGCDGWMPNGNSNSNNSDSDKPVVTPPTDATFACDGAGNTTEIDAWLAEATSTGGCGNAVITHDYEGPTTDCVAVTVTWTATDDCDKSGTGTATFMIVDDEDPSLTVPDDLSVTCGDAGTADALADWLDSATATDNCSEAVVTTARDASAGNCTATITWTATDECGNAVSASASYTTTGDVTAPTMTLVGDSAETIECGDTWEDPGVTATDDCDALVQPDIAGTVDSSTPGVYALTYDIVDACGNAGPTLMRTVTVVDTTPPIVTLKDTIELWPPNHRLVTLTLADLMTVTDSCEGELDPNVFGTILELYSDEPDNANGDGNTTGDIAIVDSHTFTVRVERQGGGNGRVYGIRFEVTDSEGNTVEETAHVQVPHDQSGSTAVDDGAAAGHSVTP